MRWLDGITELMDMSLNKLQELLMTGKPGLMQSTVSQRVKHDWTTELTDWRHWGSVTGLGGSSRGGHDNSLQDSGCILSWRIPWNKEPGGLQSIGLQRVGHNWSILAQHSTDCTISVMWLNHSKNRPLHSGLWGFFFFFSMKPVPDTKKMRTTGLHELQEQKRVTAAILGSRNRQRLPLLYLQAYAKTHPCWLGRTETASC